MPVSNKNYNIILLDLSGIAIIYEKQQKKKSKWNHTVPSFYILYEVV